MPVIIPPGFARLLAQPISSGLGPISETTGTFGAALCAAWIDAPPAVPITLAPSETNSVVRVERRPAWPSANRYSTRIFLPSTYPERSQAGQERVDKWLHATL